MEIGISKQDYGLFCLAHSQRYGGKTIDKLTFTVPKWYFRKNLFQHKDRMSNPVFYVEYCHNQYCKLHLHGEYINPQIPMLDSVAAIFRLVSTSGVFLNEINQKIQRSLERCAVFNNSHVEFIRFLNTSQFRLSELELAFDFFGCTPYANLNKSCFKTYLNSLYSRDHKQYYRKVFKEDDSYGLEKSGTMDSIFIIYDRGLKLGVPEQVWRAEWRIRDKRAVRLLDNTDLRQNMNGFIYSKGHRIRNTTNKSLPFDPVDFNWAYVQNHFPIFALLTTG
jgi:hypothetical protein